MSASKINLGLKVCVSFARSLRYRLFSRKKIQIKLKQTWEGRPALFVSGKGSIHIEKWFHPRKNVYLRAVNGKIAIGNNVFMNHNVCITSMNCIEIGDNTTIANNVVIVDHDHDYKKGNGYLIDKVKIGNNVWIGANATILRGTVIEDNSVIAAGSIVKGYVPENSIYYNSINIVCRPIER